ncbi:MAG: PhzF family phenazine biosynthesis isomerase [Acidobacteriota bacterium]
MGLKVVRYSAFTADGRGGNPAGVVFEAAGATESEMLQTAADVGDSESAFIVGQAAPNRLRVRYFSPLREVDFCGHATIATAIAWAERAGTADLVFETAAGEIPIELNEDSGGLRATLTSVPASVTAAATSDVDDVLTSLGWRRDELDPELPPRVAFGGVEHLVLATRSRRRLATLSYDFDRLKALMLSRQWITLQLISRESDELYHSRNPFPVGGVVEDPATGAAAAAFGGYVREVLGLKNPFRIRQGEDMGSPSDLWVDPSEPRIRVSGSGQRISQ